MSLFLSFWQWWLGRLSRRTVLSKFFDKQISSISTEELVLPCLACCLLSRLHWNGHSLLLSSYLSRISRIENPSCSARGQSSQNTSHFILHCPATNSLRRLFFGDSLSLSLTSDPDPEELPGFCSSMVFRHVPIHQKGSDNNNMRKKGLSEEILRTILSFFMK